VRYHGKVYNRVIFKRKTLLAAIGLLSMLSLPVLANGDEIKVIFPRQPNRAGVLHTFFWGRTEYLNTRELAQILGIGAYINQNVDKQVLYFQNGDVKITAFSSFIIVNDRAYQTPATSYFDGENFFLPVKSFFGILGKTVLPGARYDPDKKTFMGSISNEKYNIFGATIESKANGTLIRIKTSQAFDMRNLVRFITDSGWLVVQVPGGKVDTLALGQSQLGGLIRDVQSRQLERSAELRFKLAERVILPELYQVQGGSELHVAIRNPVRKKSSSPEDMRSRWYLDTIVIDPGHGGKDPGAVGAGGLKEKTVALDVALRLGRLIKRNTNMKVVYTRDEDVFVPLFQRGKIANESSGKLFISLHCNSAKSRNAKGFESWFLAPANTPEAIEVAQRENSVIALEESNHAYEEFSNESFILTSMAHSVWMKESEDLGAIMQSTMAKRLGFRNRGVKQTNLIVLVGAAMPKVLVEMGFISNRIEEKKLGTSEYRQKLAEGIFEAITLFRDKYEEAIVAEQHRQSP